MDLVTAAHTVASVLLVVAGPHKVVDPAPSVEFLVELGVPLSEKSWSGRNRRPLGRMIGVLEMALGLAALLIGGTITASLVAATYTAFAVLMTLAIRRGVDSCACFGRSAAPPTALHVIIDMVLAVTSFAAIAADTPLGAFDSDRFGGFGGVVFVGGVGVAAGLAHAVLDGRLLLVHRR